MSSLEAIFSNASPFTITALS